MVISDYGLSRRGFINGVGIGGVALAATGTTALAAPTAGSKAKAAFPDSFYILNARLETGFDYDGKDVVATRTELKNLRIENGKIAEILPASTKPANGAVAYDAQGLLMLPTFKDLHIHLDKTYYGGPWQAVRPNPNGVFDRIKEEQALLPKLLPVAEERTGKLIDLMHAKGTTIARSHCNIDPVVGLKNLEHLKNALAKRTDGLTCEIVAFPQHGLLYSNCEGLMREAMTMGVDYVGGLDPTVVDSAMEKSIDTMFQIAVDSGKGIDIHLHEGGETGLKAIRRIMDMTEQAKLQNKVTISHAFALASLPPEAAKDMFTRLNQLGITIATSVPIGKGMMPLRQLRESGVNIICGTDSVIDHWDPFGTCDILGKASLVAQLYRASSEYNLNRTLGYATGWVTPLNDKGEQVWPKVGDVASVNFLPASCSAEAVARVPERVAVLHKGKLVAGGLNAAS